jgi:hypothetical protein
LEYFLLLFNGKWKSILTIKRITGIEFHQVL